MAKRAIFRNMGMGKKLGFGFTIIVMVTLMLGTAGLYSLSKLSRSLANLENYRIPDLQALSTLNYQRMAVRVSAREMALTESSPDASEKLKEIMEARANNWKIIDEAWERYLLNPRMSAKGVQLLEQLKGEYAKWRAMHADLDGIIRQLFQSTDPERKKALYRQYDELVLRTIPISDAMGNTFNAATANNHANTSRMIGEDAVLADNLVRVNLLAMGVGIVLAVFLSVLITRNITVPLASSADLLSRISDGDLTVQADKELRGRGDEIGVLVQSIHEMTENIIRQMREIGEVSTFLGTASAEIAATVSQVTSGAQESAASVMETTATVEEVTHTADATNRKAREVASSAKDGLQVAHAAQKSIESLTDGMQLISEQMASIAETVMRLSEQSHTIGEITATVDDIAERSNLLAVNAAVEAAKAGEHGKGFTVVAQEIKSLAEQSKQATRQVRTILNDIQKAVSAVVMATEQGSKAVDQGLKEAGSTNESILALNRSFAESAQSAAQIAAANNEQLEGMTQVSQAMDNIKEAGNQNLISMRQLESSAQTLREMGHNLNGLMKRYKMPAVTGSA